MAVLGSTVETVGSSVYIYMCMSGEIGKGSALSNWRETEADMVCGCHGVINSICESLILK